MPNKLQTAMLGLHAAVYRRTNGRLLGSIGPLPLLLLTTTGRKTGKERTAPLGYLPDNGRLVLVASAGGSPKHPAWYLNLTAEPAVTVQVKADVFEAHAETASPEERDRLWPLLVERHGGFEKYQAKVDREIPLVVVTPTGS